MAVIAAYYGLPTLSVRAATFHQMLRHQHGYRVRPLHTGGVGWVGRAAPTGQRQEEEQCEQ